MDEEPIFITIWATGQKKSYNSYQNGLLYNNNTSFQEIALKVFMIIPDLMMQKPSAKSKGRDHVKILSQRLELWQTGDLLDLLREGKIIQSKLASPK